MSAARKILKPGITAPSGPSLPLSDGFTDSNGTLLENHTPDGQDASVEWVKLTTAGTSSIQSNACNVSTSGGDAMYAIEFPANAYIITVPWSTYPDDERYGVLLYYENANNYIAAVQDIWASGFFFRGKEGGVTFTDSGRYDVLSIETMICKSHNTGFFEAAVGSKSISTTRAAFVGHSLLGYFISDGTGDSDSFSVDLI